MTDLVIIAKECRPGHVKTRLHPPFSLEEAAELAAAALDDTIARTAGLEFRRRILAFDGDVVPASAAGFEVIRQVDGGLDERLAAVFDALEGPALLLGMDTPQVDGRLLAPVLPEWPTDADAVFGRAEDGGFWALGMREPRGDLIRGVPMSRADTGRRQLERLTGAGLRVLQLPVLCDVDDVETARRAARDAPGGAFAAAFDRLTRGAAA